MDVVEFYCQKKKKEKEKKMSKLRICVLIFKDYFVIRKKDL